MTKSRPINNTFLKACRKEAVKHIPVWYMRQAGRYDPEYREIKQKYTLLEICRQPELAARITLMPVEKLGVDAAILYSDIMNPVASIGIQFDIVKDVGPVIHNPIRNEGDVERLQPIQVEEDLGHILETIRILKQELTVPLIGFAGAPFTLASYLIEGRPTKNYRLTKQLMYNEPEIWHKLMDKLARMCSTYLKAQIAAGADAVQVFDSWAGALSPADYSRYCLPAIRTIFEELADLKAPKIYFPGVASGELLPLLQEIKADVISVDWRIELQEARKRLGDQFALQGNLDPMTLMAPWPVLEEKVKAIVQQGCKRPGYIFNLGHGLFPEASLETLKKLTAFVQDYSAQLLEQAALS